MYFFRFRVAIREFEIRMYLSECGFANGRLPVRIPLKITDIDRASDVAVLLKTSWLSGSMYLFCFPVHWKMVFVQLHVTIKWVQALQIR